MLCVAKNRKCEYLVISRPRRRTSSVTSNNSKSRNNNNDDDNNNNSIVFNQHKQPNQARIHKRSSRMQTTRQSPPSSTELSPPKDQVRVATVSQPSLQESNNNNNNIATRPDVSLENAQQLGLSSTLFLDSLGQIPDVFPQFEPPATRDFFSSVAGPMPMSAAKIRAGRGGVGVVAEALNARGDSSKQNNHTSVYSSSSADSLFEYGVDQMDFLMDESHIPTTVAPSSARDNNKVTTEAQPTTTHSSTPPELDSTSVSTSSSCCCMMTAVSIYEALQGQLVWGDPIAGPSAASSPKSTSAGSSYSSGSSWSGLGSETGTGSGATTYHSATPLITQQTILKRQKMILLRCDSLVQCATCWSRPDFVMLIITMCDRILTSLEAVERFVCSRSDDNMNRVSSNGAAAAVDIQSTASSRAGLELSPLSRSSQVLQPGVGDWQIDDDDEMELVISLIKSRATRLGNLITMAEGTISANAWPWHERLVQALRKRSNKLVFSLSFRRFH